MVTKRSQLVALVQPGTKRQLQRCSAFTGISITRLIEMSADGLETGVLQRLKPKERAKYLKGNLTALEAFGRNEFLIRAMPDVPRVVLSAKVSAEAKEKLERYCAFWVLPVANLIYRIARNWEKGVLARLKPEQHADFLAGKLTREKMFEPIEDEGDDE